MQPSQLSKKSAWYFRSINKSSPVILTQLLEYFNAVLGQLVDKGSVGSVLSLLSEEWIHDRWPDELNGVVIILKTVSPQEIIEKGLSVWMWDCCFADVQIF